MTLLHLHLSNLLVSHICQRVLGHMFCRVRCRATMVLLWDVLRVWNHKPDIPHGLNSDRVFLRHIRRRNDEMFRMGSKEHVMRPSQ